MWLCRSPHATRHWLLSLISNLQTAPRFPTSRLSLFSYTYELPNLQLFCFDCVAIVPGIGGSPPRVHLKDYFNCAFGDRGGAYRLRSRTHSQPVPSHCPHGFSFRVPVARQAGQASQSSLFAALPMTPVQRLPAMTWEHCPLIISAEYDTAPHRVQMATGWGFCSTMDANKFQKGTISRAFASSQARKRVL
jgi:hypothetical protein